METNGGKSTAFKNSQYLKRVGTLITGTAASQLLLVLTSPILSRLYTPEDFGIFATYFAVVSILMPITALRYELAIPIAKTNGTAANASALCLLVTFSVATIALIVLNLVLYTNLFDVPKHWNWLIPINLAFSGTYITVTYWATRQKNFVSISKSKVAQAIATSITQAALFKLGATGLAIGSTFGHSIGSFRLFKDFISSKSCSQVRKKRLVYVAKRYRSFPLISTWTSVVNASSAQLAPILIAIFFSPYHAGVYFLAQRVLSLPLSVVGKAMASVFLSEASKNNTAVKLRQPVTRSLILCVSLFSPAIAFVSQFSPTIFEECFGPQWRESGWIARWMCPWTLAVLVVTPVTSTYEILNKNRIGLIFHSTLFAARVLSLAIGAWFESFYLSVTLFSFSSTILWLILGTWIATITKADVPRIFTNTIWSILTSIAILILPTLATFVLPPEFTLAAAVSTALAFLALYYILNARNIVKNA